MEIEFKGKRTDNNKWVKGYYYKGKIDDVEGIPLGGCRVIEEGEKQCPRKWKAK